jgi:hypothetical protein
MWLQKGKTESLLNAGNFMAGSAKDHPNKPWGHKGCEAAGKLCKNPQCDKDEDSIFLTVQRRVQPGRRKPAVRKTSLSA